MSNHSKKETHRPVTVHVEKLGVFKNGWTKAKVVEVMIQPASLIRADGVIERLPNHDDPVAIPKSIARLIFSTESRALCKVVPNSKKEGETATGRGARPAADEVPSWFATSGKAIKTTRWSDWQVGKNAHILKLPSTKPGSYHTGLVFACFKCGQKILDSDDIFCIQKTCIWTHEMDILSSSQCRQFTVDAEREVNEDKDCYVQKARCRSCRNVVGSYFESEFHSCLEGQPFPSFKLVTAWERSKWHEGMPALALVLIGEEEAVRRSINCLKVSKDWKFEKEFLIGGLVDKETLVLMDKAKAVLQAHEVAEARAKEAESLVAVKEKEAREAESLAAEKIKEAREAEARAKEVEKKLMTKKSKNVVWWEYKEDGFWFPYPPEVGSILETNSAKHQLVSSVVLNLQSYEVDISKMTQTDTKTGMTRMVRRREEEEREEQEQEELIVWECYVEEQWVEYPVDICKLLEQNYHQKQPVLFDLSNRLYRIDFQAETMEQLNVKSGYTRPVRRRVPPKKSAAMTAIPSKRSAAMTTAAVPPPDTWSIGTSSSNPPPCELVPVWDQKGSEWEAVEANLRATIPNATLWGLERVQNFPLWEYFCFRKDRVAKLSGMTRLVQVWHGTSATDPKLICEDAADGFMMQHSQQGLWGRGIYFAENASYSHSYARTTQPSFVGSTFYTMILANLVVGEEVALSADSSLTHCPNKPNGKGRYDTVVGSKHGSKIYVIYENGRAYPEYLVTYILS